MIFQIGALPRSGTAWISSVLNLCPDTICLHEPIDRNVPVPEGSYENWGQTGSHLLMPSIADMEADIRIYIKRDVVAVYDSLDKVVGGVDPKVFKGTVVGAAEDYESDCDVVFDFESLFTEETVREIWGMVTNSAFPKDKVLTMLNMNIQRESLEYDFDQEYIDEFIKLNDKGGF